MKVKHSINAMNKIILLFPIFIFLNVNLALANDSTCYYFYPKLSKLPHSKLTQYNNGFKSLWDMKWTDGCEIVFESHNSIVSGDTVLKNLHFKAFRKI